ncbi:ABC transporter permease [Bacillus badius]|uniref:Bacitracin transport permease protein BCRB n=1 Tax=Bacillus badius TaxID=1455 RepID=A0ABR5ARW6_BACBA|nr:ABC transporter permease [Bacillus badius]KIL77488.1 Bacitracin transport permease protein BCRB [Bacillus badius]MED4717183.1 ABC transporter permease [Bacillus badius]
MLKLMKLEWKKHQLSRYFKGLFFCIAGIFAAVGLMAWGAKAENEEMFSNYDDLMLLTNILIRVTFIIFSAVLLSRLVIDEYRSKTMQLLFSYPIERKKIMKAKLAVVFIFCFFSILLATLVLSLLIFFLNPMIHFFDAPVHASDMIATAPSVLISAFMVAGISFIPLFFGMRKKSTSANITSAVLIGLVINSTVSDGNSQVSLFQFIGVPVALCLFGLFIGYLSYYKVDRIDAA